MQGRSENISDRKHKIDLQLAATVRSFSNWLPCMEKKLASIGTGYPVP
jgi:hypothetical protein